MRTILLADDHQLVRDTLAAYLSEKAGFEVKVASSAEEAYVSLSAFRNIDLAIIDYQMPGMDGLEGLVRLRSRFPNQKTVIISGVASPEVADKAIELGALAYFPKSMPVDLMLASINELIANSPVDHSSDNSLKQSEDRLKIYGLTARERQILQMLASGQSNKSIAQDLSLKEVTVKFHITNILGKLRVSNRTQAALLANSNSPV
ncbi:MULTISPECIES: response regulator transcription factor [unclassified Ruegeria]|uniref:response regulator transcription factor n=1 Tax=unclassified Ruegeria TaxID=2625375 RepID=UPI001488C0A8|nr:MULTISPECIES: response regulator transcription factor [unclassified Ruegeria]NOE43065.1 response regulator [Ruegeria sp. HKCCD7319]